jgi:hypothetical protein
VTGTFSAPERRAWRMLRWYPRGWRARYGEEFTALLIADFTERPRCWRRGADVARGGLLARLSGAGLAGHPLDPAAARRAGRAACACALATFLTVGSALWAQLTVDWQWAPPGSRATTAAMLAMSSGLLLLAGVALAALAWLGRALLRAGREGRRSLAARPALLAAGGALILVVGGRHFGNGWPGTGGHWWPHQGLVPGGVAAFTWACTLWVSSYWAHPAALASFPAAELAWMVISPAAVVCLTAGIAGVVRQVPCPAGVSRWRAWLGAAAAAGMTLFLTGAACWVLAGAPGPRGLFHAGALDAVGLVVLAGALAAGGRALQQLHRVRPARSDR